MPGPIPFSRLSSRIVAADIEAFLRSLATWMLSSKFGTLLA